MIPFIPLFISYFYPPAGGSGLPGSQRSVKFIRYFHSAPSMYVLTLQSECYPENVHLDFNISLPVNGETIVRTALQDRFLEGMRLRSRLTRFFHKQSMTAQGEVARNSPATNTLFDRKLKRSFNQRIKDTIFNLYYFPDQIAAPWLKPAVKAGVALVREKKINVIFATGMPWTALVVGRLISKKTGVPFIADFRDPWLGNPFLQSKGRLLDWRERACERKIIEQAALVTANTVPLREEFVERYPHVPADKIISLPNGYDINDFEHLSAVTDQKKKTSGKLVLAHAGFLYGKRDPAPLFNALELLCRNFPDLPQQIEFQQFGGISLEYDLKQRFGMLIDKGVVKLLGQLPFNDCLAKLAEADILVIIQPGTKTQVPSKLYDYLCINRPILTITPPEGALGVMIREEKFGDLFAPEEIERLSEKLVELCELKQKNSLPLTPNYLGREKFDVRHIGRLLEEKMLQIINCPA